MDTNGYLLQPKLYSVDDIRVMLFRVHELRKCFAFYVVQSSTKGVTIGCYTADMVSSDFYVNSRSRSSPPCDVMFVSALDFQQRAFEGRMAAYV